MPASTIDFAALTHIIHFSLVPNPDGSLDSTVNVVSPSNSADIVTRAHAAGRKVLVCVGGANTQTGFEAATSAANQGTFITNLVNFMSARGYDGIDIDWEPLDQADAYAFTNFVSSLRTALDAVTPRPMLTAAIASPPTPAAAIASVMDKFDQINLMTYDLSGPYLGWVTWFNAPIYDRGYKFPSTGRLVPSTDGMVTSLTDAGIPPGKLGIGIAFFGWVWSGGTGTSTGGASLPRQNWTTAPTTTQSNYNAIITSFYQSNLYHWDDAAQAAYLSIDNAGSSNDKFISYEDARACQSKVIYARNRHLGGVMIWELAQDHHASQPDPLLQSIKQALATPGSTNIQLADSNIDLSFILIPLGSYQVQWTSNLHATAWNTLTLTNVTGTGGILHVTDPAATNQSNRLYRVQAPP
jgi:chitinase